MAYAQSSHTTYPHSPPHRSLQNMKVRSFLTGEGHSSPPRLHKSTASSSAAALAHLANPLAGIAGVASLLKEGKRDGGGLGRSGGEEEGSSSPARKRRG